MLSVDCLPRGSPAYRFYPQFLPARPDVSQRLSARGTWAQRMLSERLLEASSSSRHPESTLTWQRPDRVKSPWPQVSLDGPGLRRTQPSIRLAQGGRAILSASAQNIISRSTASDDAASAHRMADTPHEGQRSPKGAAGRVSSLSHGLEVTKVQTPLSNANPGRTAGAAASLTASGSTCSSAVSAAADSGEQPSFLESSDSIGRLDGRSFAEGAWSATCIQSPLLRMRRALIQCVELMSYLCSSTSLPMRLARSFNDDRLLLPASAPKRDVQGTKNQIKQRKAKQRKSQLREVVAALGPGKDLLRRRQMAALRQLPAVRELLGTMKAQPRDRPFFAKASAAGSALALLPFSLACLYHGEENSEGSAFLFPHFGLLAVFLPVLYGVVCLERLLRYRWPEQLVEEPTTALVPSHHQQRRTAHCLYRFLEMNESAQTDDTYAHIARTLDLASLGEVKDMVSKFSLSEFPVAGTIEAVAEEIRSLGQRQRSDYPEAVQRQVSLLRLQSHFQSIQAMHLLPGGLQGEQGGTEPLTFADLEQILFVFRPPRFLLFQIEALVM
ncbi:unnamed protein product [Parajaminaea phylloscopi]